MHGLSFPFRLHNIYFLIHNPTTSLLDYYYLIIIHKFDGSPPGTFFLCAENCSKNNNKQREYTEVVAVHWMKGAFPLITQGENSVSVVDGFGESVSNRNKCTFDDCRSVSGRCCGLTYEQNCVT